MSEVFFLSKGWLGFLCNCPEDVATLLDGIWVNGKNSLMLKRWRIAFNPETKYFSLRHLWVLLPGLPLFLWNEGALTAIGNSLGKFLMVDRVVLAASARKVGRVLVELDIHQGLSETLDIEWRGKHYLQKLDYLGIPFRCSICRSTSHLRRDCKGYVVNEEMIQEETEPVYSSPDLSMETGFYGFGAAQVDSLIPFPWKTLLCFG
jgi:hypothetical protein